MDYIKHPVYIEDTATPDHRDAVTQAFARAGFDVDVEAGYGRRSADVLPWIVQVDLLLPVKVFLLAVVGAAGTDAYSGVKKWVKDVRSARAGAGTGEGSIQIRDPDHTTVILPTTLPDEGVDALRDLDWDEMRSGYLVWDPDRKVWWDPLKR